MIGTIYKYFLKNTGINRNKTETILFYLSNDTKLVMAPIVINDLLNSYLYSNLDTAIFSSATLAVDKKFNGGRIINRDGRAVRGLTRGVIR